MGFGSVFVVHWIDDNCAKLSNFCEDWFEQKTNGSCPRLQVQQRGKGGRPRSFTTVMQWSVIIIMFSFLKVVRYHSGGFGINPHMFECGEVRLSLFRADFLPSRKLWQSYKTTVLELLVSIQDRVLNADPLFNQPVIQDFGPSVVAEYFSLLYNEDILIKSLKIMMHIMNKPPKHFEAFVVGHFRNRLSDILLACQAYSVGLQVGGSVGNKHRCCSIEFQHNVMSCIGQLLGCFERKIGVTKTDFVRALTGPMPPQNFQEFIQELQDEIALKTGKKTQPGSLNPST
ncbi:hypothetical protein SSX86_005352 [Deinandra increscens subsp. villosa]|uniref:Uncharacterized protein n=1 Tax=Deinandra increscens subsp. villosa TaxID=3103831 RepID=A0AAP0DQC2_9ASTR